MAEAEPGCSWPVNHLLTTNQKPKARHPFPVLPIAAIQKGEVSPLLALIVDWASLASCHPYLRVFVRHLEPLPWVIGRDNVFDPARSGI